MVKDTPLEVEGVNGEPLEVEEIYVLVVAVVEVVVAEAVLYKQFCISCSPQNKCGRMLQGNRDLCGNTWETFCPGTSLS